MLCIDRKVEERIIVEHMGKTLVILIRHLDSGRVRLGFEGPKEFIIKRKEIYEQDAKTSF